MMKDITKGLANNPGMICKHKRTGRRTLQLLSIMLVILLSQLISGCSTHSGQSTNMVTAADGRLVDMGNGVCQDTKTGKMWQIGSSKTIKSLADAESYAANLAEGGYHDWRLPMVTELYDLYMIFDLHENGNCNLQAEGTYWSGEADLEDRVGTWELDDNCDPERQYIPKKKGQVRAIRP